LKNSGAFFVLVENFQLVTFNERDFTIFSPKLGEILTRFSLSKRVLDRFNPKVLEFSLLKGIK
jgi:hypothetical protein